MRTSCGAFMACACLLVPAQLSRAEPAKCTQTNGPTRALGLFDAGRPVPLEEGFADPPAISRAQCWWQCHGSAFAKPEITRQIEAFKAAGMGGVTVKDTLAMPRDEKTAHIEDIPFLSERWLEMFAHIVSECGRLGLICRSRLGSGWNAGGPWVTPEMSSQELSFAVSEPISGPRRYTDGIPRSDEGRPKLEAIRVGDAFVLAREQKSGRVVDLSDKVAPDRTLRWDVPQGNWRVISCFGAPSGIRLLSASPTGDGLHHDHLSEKGTDVQLHRVAEPMLAGLGGVDGTAFDGFHCDSWEIGRPTWTSGFREAFLQRRGYDPLPFLPTLMKVEDQRFKPTKIHGTLTEEQCRFLFDLRTTVSDLIIETHYRRVNAWCRRHGVAFEAEAGGPHIIPNDPIRSLGAVDIPQGEFWMRRRSNVKLAASAAHAYGKRLIGLESWTATINHFAIRPARMKTRVDEAFLLGGNYLTSAVTEYSPVEAGRPGWVHNAGPHLNRNQTWWPMARPFFDYLARCCFLLQSGRNVAHVAVYYTFRGKDDGLWHTPKDDDLSKRSKAFAFDYLCDDVIQKHMQVRDGRIVLDSGATYGVLYVIPTPHPTMPLATLAKIRDLLREGATVVWAGDPPSRCPGLTDYPRCDERLRAIAKALWEDDRLVRLPGHDYARLEPIVAESATVPCWRIKKEAPLRFVHRRTDKEDIFFVVNRAGRPVETPVEFRIQDRPPELWDPLTGTIEPAHCEQTKQGVRVPMRFDAHGSVFVVFRPGGKVALKQPGASKTAWPVIELSGPWELAFLDGPGAPDGVKLDALTSWSENPDPAIRHFSGIAAYRTGFTLPDDVEKSDARARLDLGEVREVCEVFLNGKRLGVRWCPPYAFDVTEALQPGENRLEVRVANLWHNRIVGDAALPKSDRKSRMVPETHYERMRGKKLVPSGLLGPLRILRQGK